MDDLPTARPRITEKLEFTYLTRSARQRRKLRQRIVTVLQEDPQVLLAYLHGSFSREEPFRDVDIALWLQSDDPKTAYHYSVQVAITLSTTLGLPVDIQVLNQAPLPFQYFVLSYGIQLLPRNQVLHYRLLDLLTRQYLDFQTLTQNTLSP